MYQQLFLAATCRDALRQGATDQQRTRLVRPRSEQWHAIVSFLAENVEPLLVRVAVSDADGDGLEPVRWNPLRTARYDAELDELELIVAVERGATLRYLVSGPRRLLVEAQLGQHVLRVRDASGLETVIRVRKSRGSRGAPDTR